MKKAILTCIFFIVSFTSVPAQVSLFEGSASAGVVGDTTMFNVDFFDPLGIPDYSVRVNYIGQNDEEYTTAEMEYMLEYPYYATTLEHAAVFTQSPGNLNFYFSAGTDSLVATQSPENTDDIFPPPTYIYAPFSRDGIGDADEPLGDWLDLTGSGMCYSEDRVYGYMENVSGTWPTSEGLDGFIYGVGFVPYNIQDTVIWAMVYANIPFVITPGLYKLSLADTSFTRLGDIDYDIDEDGILHMACDIADFDNDSDWPGWPAEEGFLLSSAISITLGLTSQALNDYTYPSVYEPQTSYIDFDNNTIPEITNYALESVPGEMVTVNASYLDADNNLPMTRILLFDWGFYEMGSYDHTYDDTSTFTVSLDWPGDGWHYYYFQFSDGVDMITTMMDSVYLSTVSVDEKENLPVKLSLDQNYPNPFNAETQISFTIDKAAHINLTVYDILGKPVIELVNDYANVGTHTVSWNGSNLNGQQVASGLYFYQLKVDDQSVVRKMNLIK